MLLLTCPICQTSLRPIAIGQAVIWQCVSCQGAMANLAVLRQYLGKDVVRSFWRKAMAESATRDKKCPSCRQPLRAFAVQQNQRPIILDICRHCYLIWFDKGELDAFPKTKMEELPAEVRRDIALMKTQFENELEDERARLEDTLENAVGIIQGIIFLLTCL